MLQVECSVLPQLGAKKQGSDRGASGPITIQVPLSICLRDSPSGPDPTSALHMDGQASLGVGPGASTNPTLSILTAKGTHIDTSLPDSVASESALQASVRGSRGGSSRRRKRATEATDAAGNAELAGASEDGRASKQHKPDLLLLQDKLLR